MLYTFGYCSRPLRKQQLLLMPRSTIYTTAQHHYHILLCPNCCTMPLVAAVIAAGSVLAHSAQQQQQRFKAASVACWLVVLSGDQGAAAAWVPRLGQVSVIMAAPVTSTGTVLWSSQQQLLVCQSTRTAATASVSFPCRAVGSSGTVCGPTHLTQLKWLMEHLAQATAAAAFRELIERLCAGRTRRSQACVHATSPPHFVHLCAPAAVWSCSCVCSTCCWRAVSSARSNCKSCSSSLLQPLGPAGSSTC